MGTDRHYLTSREYYVLRELFGLVSAFSTAQDALEKRVRSIPGGWRDMRLIQAVATRLMQNILATVPEEKLMLIRKELAHTKVRVSVERSIGTPDDGTKYFAYVPYNALERIMARVVDDECLCCDKTRDEVLRCQLRKDIEATYPFEYPKRRGECPFMGSAIDASGGKDDV